MVDVVIIHFNTPELTQATAASIKKHSPGCRITIFDNSTERPFPRTDGVYIFDNTKGNFINFDAFLQQFPDKQPTTNNWGSAKHCKSVDYLWGMFPHGFILADSDILLKRDITMLPDESQAFVGEVFQDFSNKFCLVPRVLPYLCWINVPMCRKQGIRYFDPERNWQLKPSTAAELYDAGASFFEDCADKRLPFKRIDLSEYIEHFGGGSYKGRDYTEWLQKNRDLYE